MPHVRAQIDGVAQPERARQDVHRAAAQPRDGIDGRLEHALVAAAQVAFVVADGEGEQFFPLRPVPQVAAGRTRIDDLRPRVGCFRPGGAANNDGRGPGGTKKSATIDGSLVVIGHDRVLGNWLTVEQITHVRLP